MLSMVSMGSISCPMSIILNAIFAYVCPCHFCCNSVPEVADLESRVQGEERELHLALTGTYSCLLVIAFGIDLLAG